MPDLGQSEPRPPFAPMAMDEHGNVSVICEMCGSSNLDFDGADIDKCRDCGHWRYRAEPPSRGQSGVSS